MMTRDEFGTIVRLIEITHPGRCTSAVRDALAHDQAQRAVIERYRKRVAAQAEEIMTCVDDTRELSKQIEQQAKEIERLQAANNDWQREFRDAVDSYNSLEQENTTLREALQLLYDCQNGCPLPKYEADWNRAMRLSERALKELG